MRRFELSLPDSLEACLQVLAARGSEARLVAGGTDLLPQLKNGLLRPGCVVDLSGVAELRTVVVNGSGARVGAAASARDLELAPELRRAYPALAEAAGLVGSIQVRNLATIGGNICNAAPSADLAPPLVALEAEAVIAGPRGRRRVSLDDFFTGVRRTVLQPDELLVELVLPARPVGSGATYVRHTPRRELDIAVVGVASRLDVQGGRCVKARVVLGAVAPTPVRAGAAEALLEGQTLSQTLLEQAAEAAVESARPISDQRGSAEFRRHLVRVLTRRTLETAWQRAQSA